MNGGSIRSVPGRDFKPPNINFSAVAGLIALVILLGAVATVVGPRCGLVASSRSFSISFPNRLRMVGPRPPARSTAAPNHRLVLCS